MKSGNKYTWVDWGSVGVQCLALEHSIHCSYPSKVQTWVAQSRVQLTNYKTTHLSQEIKELDPCAPLRGFINIYQLEGNKFSQVDRNFVRINGCDPDTQLIPHGVPQGSVLGPTLFSLFTNDLPKAVRSAETYLYADDKTIFCVAETHWCTNKHTK